MKIILFLNVAFIFVLIAVKRYDYNSIVKELSIDVSKPEEPESLKVLIGFLSGDVEPEKVRKYFPSFYVRSLLFTFSDGKLPAEYSTSDELFHEGFALYELGNFRRATDLLEKAMSGTKDPELLPATLFLIGRLGSRNVKLSSIVYREILNRYPDTPYYRNSILDAAETFLFQGNFPAARKLLKFAEEQLGIRKDRLYRLLGLCEFFSGDYRGAVKNLESVKEKDYEVLNFLSYAYFKLGDLKRSASILRFMVRERMPFSSIAYGRLVYLSRRMGERKFLGGLKPEGTDLARAMWALNGDDLKVLSGEAERSRGILKVGLLYALAGRTKSVRDAISAYSRIEVLSERSDIEEFARRMKSYLAFSSKNLEPLILNDPEFIAYNPSNDISNLNLLFEKAHDYEESGQPLKAYGLYRIAISRIPDTDLKVKTVLKLVDLDLSLGNFKRALLDADLIPRRSRKYEDMYNFCLFRIYNFMGETLKSYEFAEKVSDINSVPEEYRVNFAGKLASYYKLSGKKGKALKLIEYIIGKGAGSVDYDDLVRLSIFAEKQGKLKDALKLIDEAERKAKSREQKVESLFWKSSFREEMGDRDGALIGYLKIYYQFSDVEPWASTSIYRAAGILERKGDLSQALKLYMKVVKLKGNTEEGLKAADKVRELKSKIGGK